MADRTGLEPATSAVTGQHSNQLNYRSFFYDVAAFLGQLPLWPISLLFFIRRTAKIMVLAPFNQKFPA